MLVEFFGTHAEYRSVSERLFRKMAKTRLVPAVIPPLVLCAIALSLVPQIVADTMRNVLERTIAAAVGALATAVIAIGPVAAADLEEVVPPQYGPPQTYRGETPIEEDYPYPPPPPIYGYVAPPPVAYYAYPPRAVVVPPPYYVRPYAYRAPAYVVRRPGPYVVRGVGPYRWSRRVRW